MSGEAPVPMIDLHPAAERVAALVRGTRAEQLGDRTPCPDYTVGDLLDHVNGLALAFARAARKETSMDDPGPSGDGTRLPEAWREVIPEQVVALAQAWQAPQAWSGRTTAGGVAMDGAEAGIVALDELVLHGWDLAVSTGQPYAADGRSLEVVRSFVAQVSGPGTESMREGLFGPERTPPVDATPWEEVLAMAGRDPRAPWGTDPRAPLGTDPRAPQGTDRRI